MGDSTAEKEKALHPPVPGLDSESGFPLSLSSFTCKMTTSQSLGRQRRGEVRVKAWEVISQELTGLALVR